MSRRPEGRLDVGDFSAVASDLASCIESRKGPCAQRKYTTGMLGELILTDTSTTVVDALFFFLHNK
jgi:hypothetical protein